MRIPKRFVWLLVVLFPLPATAQTHPSVILTARAVRTDPRLSLSNEAANTIRPDLDRSNGPGLAVNVFFSDAISAELGVTRSKSDLSASSFALGSLEMTPVTATLQYHFTPNSFADVYAGAGGAYALFKSVQHGSDFALFGYSSIDFEDDAGWLVNGGANFRIRERWGVNVDAKYMRFNVSTSARLIDGSRTNKTSVRLSPLTFGAGVTFRF